jgi:transcriptional regulator with XRE-family HTH domain
MREGDLFYVTLGQRIRERRERASLTQAQLGGQLVPPVTRASIANVEAGKQRLLAHSLAQVAQLLHVPLEELVPPALRPAPELVPAIERELREKLDLKPAIVARLTRAVQHVSTTHTDDAADSAAERPTRPKQR